jgi:uncharacterized protein (DUF1330 family)
MAAYIIGHITIKDPARWAEYCSKVPATMAPWNAELVFRGKTVQVLSGPHPYGDTVVARFPDSAAVRAWHESDAYQALIPLRNAAAEVVLVAYDA